MNFSCLISIYKRDFPEFLREALSSLKDQTLRAVEIVLVKDGPLSNELESVICEFSSILPIKVLQNENNEGLGKALKDGLELCSFDLVARMDADDIAAPDRFQKQIQFLIDNPDYDLVGSNIEEFNKIPGDLKRIKKVPEFHEEILKYAKFRSPFNHPSVAFRKSAVLKAGSYQSMMFFEDYYLWLRMLRIGNKFYNIQKNLLYFRVGNGMINRRIGLDYAKKEFQFFKACVKENLISYKDFVVLVLIRIPLRLLPLSLSKVLYIKVLR